MGGVDPPSLGRWAMGGAPSSLRWEEAGGGRSPLESVGGRRWAETVGLPPHSANSEAAVGGENLTAVLPSTTPS